MSRKNIVSLRQHCPSLEFRHYYTPFSDCFNDLAETDRSLLTVNRCYPGYVVKIMNVRTVEAQILNRGISSLCLFPSFHVLIIINTH